MSASNEELLLSAIIGTGDFNLALKYGLTADFFVGYRKEYKWLMSYCAKHRRVPSKMTFKKKWPEFRFYKVDDVEHMTLEVIKDHSRRQIMDAMDASLTAIGEGDFTVATGDLSKTLTAVMSQLEGVSESYEAKTNWEDTYETIAARVARVDEYGLAGVPSGWDTLDLATGGVQAGWSCILSARLGVGKSWSLINMAWNAMKGGQNVLYFSMEQSRHQVAMRLHSLASKDIIGSAFDNRALMKGVGFNLGSYRDFLERMSEDEELGQFNVRDTTRGRVTPLTVQAAIEEHQPDIVFIDYLTLMATSRDWMEIADTSAQVKMTAEKYEIPIWSAAQLNRSAGGNFKDPGGTETIGGSDAIGQDADLVVSASQPSPSVMRFKVTKFRHGNTGDVWDCHFDPGAGIFKEVSPQQADQLSDKDKEVD